MTARMGTAWIDAEGRRIGEADGLDRLAGARVALLGERHDRAGDHLWQARVVAGIAARRRPVVVGFEMFPRHARPALDGWASGRLDEAGFLAAARWDEVWGRDPGLYRPLFEICRAEGLEMRGLNVDRPLVTVIGRDGWDALPAAERGWLSPARPASPAYRAAIFALTGGRRPDRTAQSPEDPAFDRFSRAQGVWDRAFACALAEALAETPGAIAVGIIGRGHLERRLGVVEQLDDLGVGPALVALPDGAPGDGDLVAAD